MSLSPLLNAAGRRRSPASLPGYLAGRPPRNKGSATRPIRRPSRRSSRSCAKPGTGSTGLGPAV
jgi:hypothetical protein